MGYLFMFYLSGVLMMEFERFGLPPSCACVLSVWTLVVQAQVNITRLVASYYRSNEIGRRLVSKSKQTKRC